MFALLIFSNFLFAGDKVKYKVCLGATKAGTHYIAMTDDETPDDTEYLLVHKAKDKDVYTHIDVVNNDDNIGIETVAAKLTVDAKKNKAVFSFETEDKKEFKLEFKAEKEMKAPPENAVILSRCGEFEVELE
mgnify:CR=1 FL=1